MTEAQWLEKIALTHPKAPALAHGQEVVCDFADLADDAARQNYALMARRYSQHRIG